MEIETNGSRTEISDPEHYIPAAAGSIYVIITVTDGAKTAEFKSDALSVKPMQYAAVQFEKADAAIYKKREDQKATLVLDGRYKERHTFYENV